MVKNLRASDVITNYVNKLGVRMLSVIPLADNHVRVSAGNSVSPKKSYPGIIIKRWITESSRILWYLRKTRILRDNGTRPMKIPPLLLISDYFQVEIWETKKGENHNSTNSLSLSRRDYCLFWVKQELIAWQEEYSSSLVGECKEIIFTPDAAQLVTSWILDISFAGGLSNH